MPSLEVAELCVRYGGLAAVQGIDLSVDEGEVVVMLGANGAGKSSTLNALSGRVSVAAGSVRFNDRDITGWRADRVARAGLVQVPEGRQVFAPLTVEENLILGGYARPRKRRQDLLREAYEMFPILAERQDAPAGLLSGGEQQMLAFGRALMSEPRLLMLDEPSMGLAPKIISTIMETVAGIAARGMPILMVEQNASASFEIADRVCVIEQGRIVLDGPASQVAGDPRVLRAFLGIDDRDGEEAATPW
jgi:branched-chain amino acid transport system ATP-binding protein